MSGTAIAERLAFELEFELAHLLCVPDPVRTLDPPQVSNLADLIDPQAPEAEET